jgi:hypothetical protein
MIGSAMLRRFSLLYASLALAIVLTPALVSAADAPAATSFSFATGVVKAAFDAPPYTYMQVEVSGGPPYWVVAPVCGVRPGDTVKPIEGKYYEKIYSDTLDLTFDNLFVAGKLEINGKMIDAFKVHDLPAGCTVRR